MTSFAYYTATTLDGYIADEHDSLEWLFTQDIDQEGPGGYEPFIGGIGAMAMGATTYEWVRAHLARSGESWPYDIPCWVFTHRELPSVDDGRAVRLRRRPRPPGGHGRGRRRPRRLGRGRW